MRPRASRLVALSWVVIAFAGCSSILGIDVPPVKTTDGLGGEASAEAGTAGTGELPGGAQGVAGVAGSGTGGHVNGGGTNGGHLSGGRPGGGSAGNPGGEGGSPSLGGSAGSAGTTGGRSGTQKPAEGRSCDREGALACAHRADTERLRCEGGVWIPHTSCDTKRDELCDSRSGACSERLNGCKGTQKAGSTWCESPDLTDPVLYTCGPDLVTAEIEHCVFGCSRDGTACMEQHGSLLQVEKRPEVVAVDAYWPRSPNGDTRIPVCIQASDDVLEYYGALVDAVRDEVEQTWGRYGAIAFTGWEPCNGEFKGIQVSFVGEKKNEACTGELGGIDRIGYPGSEGSLAVRLCVAFHEFSGEDARVRSATEPLMRVVARHMFGHALGFDDQYPSQSPFEFMAPGIDWASLGTYTFGPRYVSLLQSVYGRKRSGAIVSAHGRCLTLSGTELTFELCDGSEAQAFRFLDGQLRNEGSGTCLLADPDDGALTFTACTPSGTAPDVTQTWRPAEVQVLGYGGLCLATPVSLLTNDYMLAETCVTGEPRHLWDFEWLDGALRVRLREAGGSSCVEWEAGYLFRKPCDECTEPDRLCTDPDRFEATSVGQLATNEGCLTVDSDDELDADAYPGIISLIPCSLHQRMVWNLSGRLLGGTNQVLALSENAGNQVLVAQTRSSGASPDNEIFDYYLRAER